MNYQNSINKSFAFHNIKLLKAEPKQPIKGAC